MECPKYGVSLFLLTIDESNINQEYILMLKFGYTTWNIGHECLSGEQHNFPEKCHANWKGVLVKALKYDMICVICIVAGFVTQIPQTNVYTVFIRIEAPSRIEAPPCFLKRSQLNICSNFPCSAISILYENI